MGTSEVRDVTEPTSDTVTLFRPAGREAWDLIADSGWHSWVPAVAEQPIFRAFVERRDATAVARAQKVPSDGVGYVMSFPVQRAFLDRYPEPRSPGEYLLPAEDLPELDANLAGAIVEEADYRAPVPDQEFDDAEAKLGNPLPAAWRRYLQGPSWFRRGWLASGCYIWLYPPGEGTEVLDEWGPEAAAAHPGIAIIGGNGAREHLVVDLRQESPPVLLIDIASEGWPSALTQATDAGAFVTGIESGDFDYAWT
jgi:hypothetical protein